MSSTSFIPALRFKKLTKLYDFILRITFPENKIKKALIKQLQLEGTETILDFSCGTGTLPIMIKDGFPEVNIIGIDVDDEIFAIAEKKVLEKKLLIQLRKYDGENLPFTRHQPFDKIVSSLVFHHLPTVTKRKFSTNYTT
ncbi:MAG: class I SAM-dependent methyltransferase [Chitinophagaceae bacterium]